MRQINRSLRIVLYALLLVLIFRGTAPAVISLNFGTDRGTSSIPGGTSAGIVSDSSWNNYTGAVFSGTNLNGTTLDFTAGSTLGYKANLTWASDGSTSTGDRLLMKGYVDIDGDDNGDPDGFYEVIFSQIPYAQYDVYVYIMSDVGGRAYQVTDGTTSYFGTSYDSFDGTGPDDANDTFVQTTATALGSATQANYVAYTGLTSSSLTIGAGEENGNAIGLAGIQIVPEPATMGLLAVGGFGLLLRRRCRSR